MPLVSCPDCGHLISTEAQTCPNCGASVADRTPSDSAAATAPSGEPTASAYGRIRVGDAYRTGWDATWKYLGLWLGVGVVGVMLEVAAILTLVGIILVVPVLTWVVYRFVLNTIDGDPQFNDLFAGFSDYGSKLGRMLALMIIYGALAQIPQLFTPAVNDTAGTVLHRSRAESNRVPGLYAPCLRVLLRRRLAGRPYPGAEVFMGRYWGDSG